MKNRILQLKKIACAAGIVLLMAGSARADLVINFEGVNARDGSVDVGTLAAFTEPADGSVLTSLTYTVSGLTIDADGVDNDEITVTLGVSALGTGSPEIQWDFASETVREFDHNTGVFNVAGEGIAFGVIGVTGTLSSGDALVVNSAKYTEWTFRRWANAVDEVASIDGDGAAFEYSDPSSSVALDDTAFSVTHVSGGSWNGLNLDFAVDVSAATAAVPEPSSLALFAAGMGLVGLRRRRLK